MNLGSEYGSFSVLEYLFNSKVLDYLEYIIKKRVLFKYSHKRWHKWAKFCSDFWKDGTFTTKKSTQ